MEPVELEWGSLATGITGVLGDAFPYIVGIIALIVGINLGVKLFKRYSK